MFDWLKEDDRILTCFDRAVKSSAAMMSLAFVVRVKNTRHSELGSMSTMNPIVHEPSCFPSVARTLECLVEDFRQSDRKLDEYLYN